MTPFHPFSFDFLLLTISQNNLMIQPATNRRRRMCKQKTSIIMQWSKRDRTRRAGQTGGALR